MAIGTSGSIGSACRGQLITTDVRRTRNHFASTTLSTGHHPTDSRLDPSHGSSWRTRTRRRAFTNRLNSRGTAVLTSLFEACIGRTRHGFACTGLIPCYTLRPSGLSSTHHQVFLGDAEAHFGSLCFLFGTTERSELFRTEVLITSDAVARTKFIASYGR